MKAGQKVLVVDDEAAPRQMLRMRLEKQGMSVFTAADGEDALKLFEAHKPDLVILDLLMPVMDGFTTCKKIRELQAGANVPIIVLTAAADSSTVKRAMAAGATEFVTKPISWAVIAEKITEHLS